MCVDLLVGTQMLGLCEVEPAEPEEEREIQHVWAPSVYDISGIPLGALSVCDNSDLPSDDSGDLLKYDHGLWCRGTRGVVGRLEKSG